MAAEIVNRLEFASSLTVTMTLPVSGSAVTPSACPGTSHCRTSLPYRVNSTIVLSRLPSVLGSPWGPVAFWKPT